MLWALGTLGLIHWAFGNGWWSAGLWLTTVVGFGVPYFLAARVGQTGIKRDVMLLCLVFAGPALAFIYGEILGAVADPEPGCTEECWGRLGLAALAGLALVVWEAGVCFGCLNRYVRGRRGHARPDLK